MGKEIKNIIVLKNVQPNIFEEVIFILKKDIHKKNSKGNLVNEAKKIVDDYINNNALKCYATKSEIVFKNTQNNRINLILNVSLVLSCLLFAMLLIKIF